VEAAGAGGAVRGVREPTRASRRRDGGATSAAVPRDRATQGRAGLAQKGRLAGSPEQKRALIEPDHPTLSVARQCALLGLARSSWYYQPQPPSATPPELLDRLDEQYTRTPFHGSTP
jgi:hypothetical protein